MTTLTDSSFGYLLGRDVGFVVKHGFQGPRISRSEDAFTAEYARDGERLTVECSIGGHVLGAALEGGDDTATWIFERTADSELDQSDRVLEWWFLELRDFLDGVLGGSQP